MSLCLFVCVASLLAGAARHCARRHGDAFRPEVCVALAIAGGFVVAIEGSPPTICIVLGCVVVCAATDISSGYVYDAITFPTFCVLLVASLAAGTLGSALLWTSMAVTLCFGLYVASRARGLGMGDIKLFAIVAMGMYSAIGAVLAGAFIIGAAFAGVMMMRGRLSLGQTIPFAPFIALATMADVPYRVVGAQ